MVEAFLPDEQKLNALREALPATAAGIYLDTLTCGPLPAETARAMSDADAWDLRTGRGGPDRAEDSALRTDEARAVLAALVGGAPSDVELTHGSSDAMARGVRLLEWVPGDRMVVIGGLADRTLRTLSGAARFARINLDVLPFEPHRSSDTNAIDALAGALAEPARLVVAPIVDETTGAPLPVDGLAGLAAERGASLGLDAGCAAGVVPIEVGAAGAAFVSMPGHRWLLGPEGTGGLWVDRRLCDRDRPTISHDDEGSLTDADPLPRTAALGLARSVGWLEMYVGLPWIYQRTVRLASTLARGLAAIDGVDVLTPLDRPAAIASFRIRRWDAAQAAEELMRRVHAIISVVRTARGPAAIVASVGAWNSEDELHRFVEGVSLLARHAPDSLPRRVPITVLRSSS